MLVTDLFTNIGDTCDVTSLAYSICHKVNFQGGSVFSPWHKTLSFFLVFQEVAVFVFDKKLIDKYQKFEKDQIVDSLKKGVQQLTRLRHPRLLTVQHPLEESRWATR